MIYRLTLLILLMLVLSPQVIATQVTRGPYLQNQNPFQTTIKWQTDTATDSVLHWGSAVNQLNYSLSNQNLTTNHTLTINNLTPDSVVFYAVADSNEILAGNDIHHVFKTPPLHGTQQPVRFWVLGDSGTANANAAAVRDAYANYTTRTDTHLWFMLGDNAYSTGTDLQYQSAVFDMYPDMLRKAALWPVVGNHDAANANSITGTGVYYDVFDLPQQGHSTGHSSGVDSGTEAFYSFDYANVHFIMLESNESSSSFRDGMAAWLQSDLLISEADWTIAMWHHPPYTKGSHDSDVESRHIYMRENILPILENEGVDLVLGGHSHSYERSWLIDSHYGFSDTFSSQLHLLNGSTGNPHLDEAYLKPSLGSSPHDGTVYVVAGSSGKISNVEKTPHPAMRNTLALKELGSLVIDVSGHHLDVKFLKSNGEIEDVFKITKVDLIFIDDFE